ncbi:hypothetical protein P7F88_21735 [Vibrio hannami]|uniref:hypothetical protein n=1 Tax=Vibrio hannami TaxID=2717094 RepID=UPI002410508E|nr:hypothetical protein [Vibrio hannami]MDG3088544.1 hypothetical protein [Vibrio hannami]
MTTQLTKRAVMLLDNTSDNFVVTLENGEHKLMHESELSGILKDGHPKERYGYADIERCWDGENLAGCDDYC